MYTYRQVVEELSQNAGVAFSDIFEYDDTPLEEYFNRLFIFYQENLSKHCDEYNIQPARIFFQNEFSVNAYAGIKEGYFIIKINAATVITLQNLFYEHNYLFDGDGEIALRYSPLTTALKSLEMHPGFLMFQVATQFTYYHELCHLIQKSDQLSSFLNERNISVVGQPYFLIHHLMEFDSDIFGAHQIVFHIADYWKKFPVEYANAEVLTQLLSVSCASIFIYFMHLENNYKEIYYQDGTHPHPVVRITYIIDTFLQASKFNLNDCWNIELKSILREAFDIAEKFCEVVGMVNIVDRYRELFIIEHNNIENYIKFLVTESNKAGFLTKNRFYN